MDAWGLRGGAPPVRRPLRRTSASGDAATWPTSTSRPRSTGRSRGAAPARSANILLALADAEARHIAHWQALLGEHDVRCRAGVRSRVLTALARPFGSVFVLALAQNAKSRSPYEGDLDATRR